MILCEFLTVEEPSVTNGGRLETVRRDDDSGEVVAIAARLCSVSSPVAVYLVQCLQLALSVSDHRRPTLQADIARLEAEPHPELASGDGV